MDIETDGPQIDPSTVQPAGDDPFQGRRSAPEPETESAGGVDAAIEKALAGYDDDEPEQRQGQPRDPVTKRFVAKEAAPEDPATEPEASVESESEVTETDAQKEAKAVSEGHFRGWSPEERAAFAKLAPEAQEFVLSRQRAVDANYQRRTQEFQSYRTAVEPLVDVYRKHNDHLAHVAQEINATPQEVVSNILATEAVLRYGTFAQKVQTLQRMAQEYGVPLSASEPDMLADPVQMGGEHYPVIHDLRQQVQNLTRELTSYKRQNEEFSSRQVSSQIESFGRATDAQGQPLHPHFEAVRGTMGQLLSSGQATSLEDAYAKAVEPINKAIADGLARQKAQAAEQQRQALEKAKRVQPVRVSGMTPGGQTKARGLDAILDEALTQSGMY